MRPVRFQDHEPPFDCASPARPPFPRKKTCSFFPVLTPGSDREKRSGRREAPPAVGSRTVRVPRDRGLGRARGTQGRRGLVGRLRSRDRGLGRARVLGAGPSAWCARTAGGRTTPHDCRAALGGLAGRSVRRSGHGRPGQLGHHGRWGGYEGAPPSFKTEALEQRARNSAENPWGFGGCTPKADMRGGQGLDWPESISAAAKAKGFWTSIQCPRPPPPALPLGRSTDSDRGRQRAPESATKWEGGVGVLRLQQGRG